VSCCRQLYMF